MTTWQQDLQNLTNTPEQLTAQLPFITNTDNTSEHADQLFKTRIPPEFLAQIDIANPDDPLLKQVIPHPKELTQVPGYTQDPLKEQNNKTNPIPGLLHKYHGRVLLIVTGSCAIHCRYCFRRHFPYQDNNPGKKNWQAAFDYITQDPTITEVILSGGDPLMANDQHLQILFDHLNKIEHVKTIRIHTRIPTVMPSRITDDLIQILTQSRAQPIMVIHCNHANEISSNAAAALNKLHQAGLMLLNQSVLLKDINNNAQILINLSQTLFENHVLPYYLHMPDKVAGTAHFDIERQKAIELIQTIQRQLPGYLVPKLVEELPHCGNKTQVSS